MSYDPTCRLWRLNGTTDERFFYSGDQMAAEYLPSTGALYRRYVFGPGVDEPIVEYDASGVRTWMMADEAREHGRPQRLISAGKKFLLSYRTPPVLA